MARAKFSVHPALESVFLTRSLSYIEKILMKYFGVFSSHSWAGEDAILRQLISDPTEWTYLDIGSGHPTYLSNTYWMYTTGSAGILIDCNEKLVNFTKKVRPRDIVLNTAISETKTQIEFFEYPSWSLTTSNNDWVESYKKEGKHPIRSYLVSTTPLNNIYAQLDLTKKVLVSIDVEGADQEIIQNFLESLRRGLITNKIDIWVLEVDLGFENVQIPPAIRSLIELGYKIKYHYERTLILKRE